jgi:GNAT superfamily N-acetyltransferase
MIRDTIIRPARLGDAETIGHIYVQSWRAAYQDIFPSSYLDGLRPESVAHAIRRTLMDTQTLCMIAESEQGPAGYISAGPERGDDKVYGAELYELYILPEVQRQGIGRQLLASMAQRLYQARYYTLMVWVLARNPNHRFYEKCGGIYLRSKSIVHAGQALTADAYGWIDITLVF